MRLNHPKTIPPPRPRSVEKLSSTKPVPGAKNVGESCNRGLPSNPTIYTTSPPLDEDQPLVPLVVVHFACPTISSVPHCCTVCTFHCPSQFVLKTERFHYVSVENRMQKYGQEGFFHLTYVEPKHQSNSHNQASANDFQRLIWIF